MLTWTVLTLIIPGEGYYKTVLLNCKINCIFEMTFCSCSNRICIACLFDSVLCVDIYALFKLIFSLDRIRKLEDILMYSMFSGSSGATYLQTETVGSMIWHYKFQLGVLV